MIIYLQGHSKINCNPLICVYFIKTCVYNSSKGFQSEESDLDRQQILKIFHAQIHINGHIIGACVGSGMTAKYAAMGGADMLLAVMAGKYRIMGRSSLASYFCYGNNNTSIMELGTRELLPVITGVPVLFGVFAQDPFVDIHKLLMRIKSNGFSGVTNFPTIALIDGQFREALDEDGNTFDKEVTMIGLAHQMGCFTVGFVTNLTEAMKMLAAGADVICVHLGLTRGGFLGAKNFMTITEAKNITDEIFSFCKQQRSDVITTIYAGAANTPVDMKYLYQNMQCEGYIGGSTFDRIPTEKAILEATKSFKNGELNNASSDTEHTDYIQITKHYIEKNYMKEVRLEDIALVTHVSSSYLSTLFKKKTGTTFTNYLITFRIGQAKKLLKETDLTCKEVALNIGYTDYAQFSKIFKKYTGVSPIDY